MDQSHQFQQGAGHLHLCKPRPIPLPYGYPLARQETSPALVSPQVLYLVGHHFSAGNARHISQLSKLEPLAQGKEKEAAPTGLGVNSWQQLCFSSPMQLQLMFPLVSYLYSQEVGLSIWTMSVSWLILPKC